MFHIEIHHSQRPRQCQGLREVAWIQTMPSDRQMMMLQPLVCTLIPTLHDNPANHCSSAVSLGYLDDPFTALLYRAPRLGQGEASSSRRSPLINVGTHHRTKAIDLLVDRFLEEAGASSQIVSLGAGSDSRFWRIKVGSTVA